MSIFDLEGFPERLTWTLLGFAAVIFIIDYIAQHIRAMRSEKKKRDEP